MRYTCIKSAAVMLEQNIKTIGTFSPCMYVSAESRFNYSNEIIWLALMLIKSLIVIKVGIWETLSVTLFN